MEFQSARADYIMKAITHVETQIVGCRCDVATSADARYSVFLTVSPPNVITVERDPFDIVAIQTYPAITVEVKIPMNYNNLWSNLEALVELIRREFERKYDLCL